MRMTPDIKPAALALVAEIDPYELACRLVESVSLKQRPAGQTARQVLEASGPENRDAMLRAALAALEYVAECINAARRPS